MSTNVPVQSAADVVNLALVKIGHPNRVGSLYDGSKAAKAALSIYAQTRDEVLRQKDWPFASRTVALTASGQSPVAGFTNIYVWPSDCIRLKGIQPATVPSADYDPQPILFAVYNDQRTSPPTKSILTTISSAWAVYVGQITDMTTWEPLFVAAVVDRLAEKLLPLLREGGSPVIDPEGAVDEAVMAGEALPPNDPQAIPPSRNQAAPQRRQ